MINKFTVYETSFHHLNNKPIMLFTTTYYMQPSFSRTFYSLILVWVGKAYAIFPQTTVCLVFLRICCDDNKCTDDNDKHIIMIAILHYVAMHMYSNNFMYTIYASHSVQYLMGF